MSKSLPNATIKQMSIQLLNAAKANITNCINDLTLLHQSLTSPSQLPTFIRILDVFEMHRFEKKKNFFVTHLKPTETR